MNNENRVERRFYPDGQVESQITYQSGGAWVAKHWHPNGVLASEIPVKNGVTEGIATFWNENGNLLGSYEMRNGTGIEKAWHPNGSLLAEISWLNGERTGIQRAYFEDGELISETYWLDGEQISRRRYLAASAEDPSLPRYDDKPKVKKPRIAKRFGPVAKNQATEADSFCSAKLSAPGSREALEWLRSGRTGTKTLGELATREESTKLVEDVYSLGAEKVWAVDINTEDPEFETTGNLIVSLPESAVRRRRVLNWCAEWAERNGYEPEPDWGQNHVFVMLD